MLVLLSALWFILRGDLLLVLPCAILLLHLSVLLALRIPRLGKREIIFVLFVRLFDWRVFGFVCFLFIFVVGMGWGFYSSCCYTIVPYGGRKKSIYTSSYSLAPDLFFIFLFFLFLLLLFFFFFFFFFFFLRGHNTCLRVEFLFTSVPWLEGKFFVQP